MLEAIPIIGGGPAGAAAALSITGAGGRAVIYEKSTFPRHKLCGEFFTPEILPALDDIGAAAGFLALGPAAVTHAELYFENRSRRFPLPEPAFGLSRYAFDHFLLRSAVAHGAELRRERASVNGARVISAIGRSIVSTRGRRLFGFKAHYSGASNDVVEVYFFPGGYCGTCPIEGGRTNVCGLAREELLRAHNFELDALIESDPRLKHRLAPLMRSTRWHISGPLRFGPAPDLATNVLVAGDAACFVDPFTGTGLFAAVQTGTWAGTAALRAAQGENWTACRSRHRRLCSQFFRRQLATTTIIRRMLDLGWAESLAGVLPGWLLFRLTRPSA